MIDQQTFHCFCDGAVKNNGKKDPDAPTYGGVGIVFLNDEGRKILQKHFGYAEKGNFGRKVTNNIMELTAAINAIKVFVNEVHPHNSHEQTLFILSDSEYVVKGYNERLRKWIHNNWTIQSGDPVSNKDLWIKLLDLIQHPKSPKIIFEHVKGHDTNEYNNTADELAVLGKEEAMRMMGEEPEKKKVKKNVKHKKR